MDSLYALGHVALYHGWVNNKRETIYIIYKSWSFAESGGKRALSINKERKMGCNSRLKDVSFRNTYVCKDFLQKESIEKYE